MGFFGSYEDWIAFILCLLSNSFTCSGDNYEKTFVVIFPRYYKLVQKINVSPKCVFYLKSGFICKAVVLTVGSGCLRLVIFGVTSLLMVRLWLVLHHDCIMISNVSCTNTNNISDVFRDFIYPVCLCTAYKDWNDLPQLILN